MNRNSHLGIEAYFMNTGMAVTDPESAPMASWDIRPRLPEIAAPTLVIGADSVAEFATPPHQAREIAAGIPNARLHIVPDKGHYFFAEDPTSLVAPVSEFLADIGLEGAIDDAALLCQAEPLR